MNIDFEKLSKPLTREDIQFRVGATIKIGDKAFVTILAYKDARVDVNRLDEACTPAYWQNSFERDSNGVLQAKIGIYNPETKEWVWKVSNGIESNTEKQKGEYSDALKRAGFMWGIGRQLYDFPKIFLPLEPSEFDTQDGKVKVKSSFKPNEWNWSISDDYQQVTAKDKNGKIRFSHPYRNNPEPAETKDNRLAIAKNAEAEAKSKTAKLPSLEEVQNMLDKCNNVDELEILWSTNSEEWKKSLNIVNLVKTKKAKLQPVTA